MRIKWRLPARRAARRGTHHGAVGLPVGGKHSLPGPYPKFLGEIMRVVVMLLTLVVGVVLAGCEKTDFEKKSESDANARRIFNLKKESSKE